jgi:ParB family chromosome partitioning protein
MPEEQFERKPIRQVSLAEKAASATGKADYSRSEFTGEDEWYTPPEYIEAAREALGSIDLDPASCELAQRTVKATRFLTIDDDGLKHEWHGRIWLNPPYSRKPIVRFVDKLIAEYESGRASAAVMLTNAATDTEWFRKAARYSSAICFTRRVEWYNAEGETADPTQGQAAFYFGDAPEWFDKVFSGFGFVMVPSPYKAKAALKLAA